MVLGAGGSSPLAHPNVNGADQRSAVQPLMAGRPPGRRSSPGVCFASGSLAGRPLAFASAGERERAALELEQAATSFDACGALRYRDSAEHELRKLGRRTQRTPRGRSDGIGLESLTERELQVARLVVDRRTNPEIAAELFLSLKTVETHMRNIFGKLGVSSRIEVARAVESASRDRTGPSSA